MKKFNLILLVVLLLICFSTKAGTRQQDLDAASDPFNEECLEEWSYTVSKNGEKVFILLVEGRSKRIGVELMFSKIPGIQVDKERLCIQTEKTEEEIEIGWKVFNCKWNDDCD